MRTTLHESLACCGTGSRKLRSTSSHSRRRLVVPATVCFAFSACWFGDPGATEPPGGFTPASLALTARIVAQSANAINVQLSYLRANQTPVLLIDSTAKIRQSSTGSYGWTGVRGFPFEIDLTRCLIDPAHLPTGGSCRLHVDIVLLSNGEPVSGTTSFELLVTPGATQTAAPIVDLAEVATVTPVPVASLDVAVDGTIALTAHVEDVRGDVIPSSPVRWRIADDAIARIDSRGIVTGLSPGTTLVTASVANRSGSVPIVVTGPSPSR